MCFKVTQGNIVAAELFFCSEILKSVLYGLAEGSLIYDCIIPLRFTLRFYRTVAAEVRKQIAGQYGGSPQLFKNLTVGTATSNTVSGLQQQIWIWYWPAQSSAYCPVTPLCASVNNSRFSSFKESRAVFKGLFLISMIHKASLFLL